jgi:hypothetical protein
MRREGLKCLQDFIITAKFYWGKLNLRKKIWIPAAGVEIGYSSLSIFILFVRYFLEAQIIPIWYLPYMLLFDTLVLGGGRSTFYVFLKICKWLTCLNILLQFEFMTRSMRILPWVFTHVQCKQYVWYYLYES